ncbi:MAG: GGDEF domain-containing protein [Gemmatimonadaceae bacterium]
MSSRPEQPAIASRFRSLDDPTSLRELARRLREGIYITDAAGRILDANPAFLEMLGVPTIEEARRLRMPDVMVDPRRRDEELRLLERQGTVREFEFWMVRPADGQLRAVVDTAYLLRDEQAGETLIHGMLVDITRRKELELQLLEQSQRDPLTGLYNRRYLSELGNRLEMEGGSATWGVIYLDVNHFKQYNDRYGHQAGDSVLVRMSRFLLSQVRAEEPVVRVGGDEFVVILSGADAERTQAIAQRLQQAALHAAPVPFSLGWAARRPDEMLDGTIGRADNEMLAVRVVERAPARRTIDQIPLPLPLPATPGPATPGPVAPTPGSPPAALRAPRAPSPRRRSR